MKHLIYAAFALLVFAFGCGKEAPTPEDYSMDNSAIDTIDWTQELHDTTKFSNRAFFAVSKIYKGPIYWTVQGDYELRQSAYPGAQTISMVVQKVHWTRLATYGPDGVLGVRYKRTPIEGTVTWRPYYELPKFPAVPAKILKEDVPE